jgi:proline iminopeptidase
MKRCLLFALLLNIILVAAAQDIKYPDSWTDGQYYTVNGAKLWVVTVGRGAPLIIIPGGPGSTHLSYRRVV